MKTIHIFPRLVFTATLLLAFVFNPVFLDAQNEITWNGGTPGQEHNWNCPRNWSANRIPGEFDQVRLPDCSGKGGFYPILKTVIESPVQYLRIESGASLTLLPGAELVVDGATTYNYGILLFGSLSNNGRLEVRNAGLKPFEKHGGVYFGEGRLVSEDASASAERK